jgi:hypothetical protein
VKSCALPFALALTLASSVPLAGCAAGDDQPTYIVLSTNPTCGTEDAGAGKGSSSGSSGSSSSTIGAQCKAYLACCEELSTSSPSMASSCSALEDQIKSADKNGLSTSTYETSCKSGLDAARRAGHCN